MSRTVQESETNEQTVAGQSEIRAVDTQVTLPFLRHLEINAAAIRRRVGIGPDERLDWRTAAEAFCVKSVFPGDLPISAADKALITNMDVGRFSGACLPMPNGLYVVILHPGQTPQRVASTMLEEIAHVYYQHKPSQIAPGALGIARRTYNKEVETEAFWTGAAVLLPSKMLALRLYQGATPETIANEFGVSTELVGFRLKIWGFWQRHGSIYMTEARS